MQCLLRRTRAARDESGRLHLFGSILRPQIEARQIERQRFAMGTQRRQWPRRGPTRRRPCAGTHTRRSPHPVEPHGSCGLDVRCDAARNSEGRITGPLHRVARKVHADDFDDPLRHVGELLVGASPVDRAAACARARVPVATCECRPSSTATRPSSGFSSSATGAA